MNDEPASTQTLKQRWDEKDAARDKQEERADQLRRTLGVATPSVGVVADAI